MRADRRCRCLLVLARVRRRRRAAAPSTPGTPACRLGVIGTGQSLSVGAASGSLLFTTPSANDLKLSLGARATSWPIDATDPELSLAPLVEPSARSTRREQPAVSEQHLRRDVSHGDGGAAGGHQPGDRRRGPHLCPFGRGAGRASITVIQKNGTGNAYAASLFEATAFARLVAAAGARYEVGAVVLTHGEAGRGARDLRRRHRAAGVRLRPGPQADHRADPRDSADRQPAASRSGDRPLDVDDRGLEGGRGLPGQDLLRGSEVPVRATRAIASTWSPGSTTGWASNTPEVFHEVVVRGNDWQPLQPIEVTRDGQTLSVRFHVPFPPLAWDEAFGAPHQVMHAGLEERARASRSRTGRAR